MSTVYEVPLSSQPQRFLITLVGVQYQVTLRWNIPSQVWIINLADANGNAIVNGIPLVTGRDLLEPYGYLDLGFQLFAQTDNATVVPPAYANLGTAGHLFAVVPS